MSNLKIEIRDKEGQALSFDLWDILNTMQGIGEHYEWNIDFIEPIIIYEDKVDIDGNIFPPCHGLPTA